MEVKNVADYHVTLCAAIPETMLRLPWQIRRNRMCADIANGMRALVEVAAKAGLTTRGAPATTYRGERPTERSIRVDFGVPVEPAPNLGPSSGAEVTAEAGSLVARTCHHGSYRALGTAYHALRQWIEDTGYQADGPPTEVYLIGPEEVSDPGQLLTEIRIPVRPAPAIGIHLAAPFAKAVDRTRNILQENGFKVISEVDGRDILEQPGAEIEDYLILGAFHPSLARRALDADRQAGLLLTCNVVVRSVGTGTLVEAANPDMLMWATGQSALSPIGYEARMLLSNALQQLRTPAPTDT